jgi:hypothetical protein
MIIKKFENFRPIGLRNGKTELGNLQKEVEIRIDLEKIRHASIQQYRHGFNRLSGKIEDYEIIDLVERAIEEITIALMQDQFDIVTHEDNYPTPGIKAGQPNRFVIRDKETKLNVVCELRPGENEFTLTVITVMRVEHFRTAIGQWVVEV